MAPWRRRLLEEKDTKEHCRTIKSEGSHSACPWRMRKPSAKGTAVGLWEVRKKKGAF